VTEGRFVTAVTPAEPLRVWHAFALTDQERVAPPLLRRLAAAGVDSRPLGGDPPVGPGLVLLRELSATLLDFVREASAGGLQRVLAIHTGDAPLAPADSWRLLAAGAADVLTWERLDDPAAAVAARLERWGAVDRIVDSPVVRENLVGRSPAWIAALRTVVEVAHFGSGSVLLVGETGTGKELVARLIHTLDQRPRKRELVVLDCTTIVRELAGSELFGHERGAYTGAVAARDGAFALADGGTLFLDEVGELPPPIQAELLRAVQERAYKRVGSNAWQRSDCRMLFATNRDLAAEVERDGYRRDLYYRLAGVTCRLPPLRERAADILPLVRHFLAQLRPGLPVPELDAPVRAYLLSRAYAGNVRELRQLVARICARHVDPGPITAGALPPEDRPTGHEEDAPWCDAGFEGAIRRALALGVGLRDIGKAATETAVRVAVADEEGSVRRAASRLGITDRALQMRRAAARTPDDVPGAVADAR
jgi:transcriptional regulator with GAF, ATPase, and Fis domain